MCLFEYNLNISDHMKPRFRLQTINVENSLQFKSDNRNIPCDTQDC